MSSQKVSLSEAGGVLSALLERLDQSDGQERLAELNLLIKNWGELPYDHQWQVFEGGVSFSLISDGKTGKEWIDHFERKGIFLPKRVKHILLSENFVPTSGLTSEVAVLSGSNFRDQGRRGRNTLTIRGEATNIGVKESRIEVACLIRDKFTDYQFQRMGISSVVTMHATVNDELGVPRLLIAGRTQGKSSLDVHLGRDVTRFSKDCGFAFEVA